MTCGVVTAVERIVREFITIVCVVRSGGSAIVRGRQRQFEGRKSELVLYVELWLLPGVGHFIRMAKNRASRGAKLSSFAFVDLRVEEQKEVQADLVSHPWHVVMKASRSGKSSPMGPFEEIEE